MSPHTCASSFVHCMDFRIQPTLDRLLVNEGVMAGDFDRVSVAGGAGNFQELRHHLTLSCKLHHPRSFLLTVHEDCGAGAKREDLEEAVRIAREIEPESEVEAFFVRLDGTWDRVF
jgi:hypothetical protein